MDLANLIDIKRIFKSYNMSEVYNLASQSYVDKSFNDPVETSNINSLGVLRLLEAIKQKNKHIKFYQASLLRCLEIVKFINNLEKPNLIPKALMQLVNLRTFYDYKL